jgi:hypothetical protein
VEVPQQHGLALAVGQFGHGADQAVGLLARLGLDVGPGLLVGQPGLQPGRRIVDQPLQRLIALGLRLVTRRNSAWVTGKTPR